MQNNQSPSSVLETISSVNQGSNISNNMMAYRLALIMEQQPQEIQSTTTLDGTERESLQAQLRAALSQSQNTQTVENYRQTLKNKYYQEYLHKLGVSEQATATPQPDNATRVENLIALQKQKFLQEMFDRGQDKLPLGQKSNYSTPEQVTPVAQSEPTLPQDNETVKQSLIPAIMNTVMTMGTDSHQGRIYEGFAYRLQLLMKEGMQLLSVIRKSGNPQTAFTAYKAGDEQEFKVTENNLSNEETLRLIKFDRQQAQQPKIQDGLNKDKDSSELGD